MHSIEGGWPYRCNRVPFFCHVFLEFRLLPDQKVNEGPHAVERLLAAVRARKSGIEFGTEFFVTLPAAQDCSSSVVAQSMRSAHQRVIGRAPEEGVGLFYSDASHLQAYGIP